MCINESMRNMEYTIVAGTNKTLCGRPERLILCSTIRIANFVPGIHLVMVAYNLLKAENKAQQ